MVNVEGKGTSTAPVLVRRPDIRILPNDPTHPIVKGLLEETDFSGFHQILHREGFGSRIAQLSLFSNPGFPAIAKRAIFDIQNPADSHVTADITRNRFTLALLMNFISFADLSDDAQQTLHSTRREAQFALTRNADHSLDGRPWRLSQQAESTFHEALLTGAVVMVNDVFAVPLNGELAGICTQTFTTPDGTTFIEGNWYAPIQATANAITTAFDKGSTTLSLERSSWQLLRGVNEYEEMVEAILEQMEEPTYRVTTMSPRDYRLKNHKPFEYN